MKEILKDNSIHSFIDYIKTKKCKNIIVMTGAGISTSAGIPDFRTPGSGLYDNLQKYKLPYPEAIFDINYFKRKPEPFFELSRELFPGLYQPTACHYFIKLLQDKELLLRNYTQNIDMLERIALVQDDYLVEAHGSFHKARCVGFAIPTIEYVGDISDKKDKKESEKKISEPTEAVKVNDIPEAESRSSTSASTDSTDDFEYNQGCGKEYTIQEFKSRVFENKVPRCECLGYIKPDIVFFGESLPEKFHDSIAIDFQNCDALIVMGTSLQVQPFANLIDYVSPTTPRLLINREECGVYHSKYGFDFTGKIQEYRRDAVYLGNCDEACQIIANEMGWKTEFEELRGTSGGKTGFDIELLVKELHRVGLE